MRRLALFAGHNYYPNGGWEDFQSYFDDLEAAKAEARRRMKLGAEPGSIDWAQIVDLDTVKCVWSIGYGFKGIVEADG